MKIDSCSESEFNQNFLATIKSSVSTRFSEITLLLFHITIGHRVLWHAHICSSTFLFTKPTVFPHRVILNTCSKWSRVTLTIWQRQLHLLRLPTSASTSSSNVPLPGFQLPMPTFPAAPVRPLCISSNSSSSSSSSALDPLRLIWCPSEAGRRASIRLSVRTTSWRCNVRIQERRR